MCVISELEKETLTFENILRYVDDYSIYSYYIGEELELGARYSSPLRTTDDNPSFSLFRGRNDRIWFKDHATNYKGDVFKFVRILLSEGETKPVTWQRVLKQIDCDFKIGLYTENGSLPFVHKKIVSKPVEKERYSIKVTSKQNPGIQFNKFWDRYDITKETLQLYNTTHVEVIHYSSLTKSHTFQIYPKELCIAYRIAGKYELYFPFADKKLKFRNDLPENWIKGLIQLNYTNNFCIITKAMKEVMFFRQHFNWDAVAGKSETTMIPKHLMQQLLSDYAKVYIWLDKDETGIKAQQKYLEKYPSLIPLSYSENIQQKDPTDRYEFLKNQSKAKEALQEITNLIQ